MLAKTDINELINDLDYVEGWLETKPPCQEYNYADANNCAFSQFLKQHGVQPASYYDTHGIPAPDSWRPFVYVKSCRSTFGEALARLRKFKREG